MEHLLCARHPLSIELPVNWASSLIEEISTGTRTTLWGHLSEPEPDRHRSTASQKEILFCDDQGRLLCPPPPLFPHLLTDLSQKVSFNHEKATIPCTWPKQNPGSSCHRRVALLLGCWDPAHTAPYPSLALLPRLHLTFHPDAGHSPAAFCLHPDQGLASGNTARSCKESPSRGPGQTRSLAPHESTMHLLSTYCVPCMTLATGEGY